MANNKNNETRTKIDDLNDSLTRAEQKVQDNKKTIMWVSLGVAAVIVLVLIYVYAILRPGQQAADERVGLADNKALIYELSVSQGMLSDSASTAQLQQIVATYEEAASEGHDGGNRAKLMTAIYAYRAGDYQKALTMLEDYDRQDKVIGATSKSLEGDCYVNLDKLPEALDCYKEALSICDENPMIAPYFLLKQATVYRAQKNFEAEADVYQTLIDKYPVYGVEHQIDFEKYLARAQASK